MLKHRRKSGHLRSQWSYGPWLWGLLFCTQLAGCGASMDLKERLVVAMAGVFEQPASASGNAEPRSLSFTLEGVTLSLEDGSLVDLYEGEPTEFTIVHRSQIIFEKELSEYADQTVHLISVHFAAAITGTGQYEKELSTTLIDPVAQHIQTFVIESAKEHRLEIGVQWQSTVTRDTATSPPTETLDSPGFSTVLTGG